MELCPATCCSAVGESYDRGCHGCKWQNQKTTDVHNEPPSLHCFFILRRATQPPSSTGGELGQMVMQMLTRCKLVQSRPFGEKLISDERIPVHGHDTRESCRTLPATLLGARTVAMAVVGIVLIREHRVRKRKAMTGAWTICDEGGELPASQSTVSYALCRMYGVLKCHRTVSDIWSIFR